VSWERLTARHLAEQLARARETYRGAGKDNSGSRRSDFRCVAGQGIDYAREQIARCNGRAWAD
jgi:hypothetical protein